MLKGAFLEENSQNHITTVQFVVGTVFVILMWIACCYPAIGGCARIWESIMVLHSIWAHPGFQIALHVIYGGEEDLLILHNKQEVDPRDPHVVDLGKFTIDKWNFRNHSSLVYEKVLFVEKIVDVARIVFNIRIAANDDGTRNSYLAFVLEQPRKLLDFIFFSHEG